MCFDAGAGGGVSRNPAYFIYKNRVAKSWIHLFVFVCFYGIIKKVNFVCGFMITIDLSYFETLGALSPIAIMWRLFIDGGWIPILAVLLWGSWKSWVFWRQMKYGATRRFVFLAIDIPKAAEGEPGQSPRAIENFFAHLDGAHVTDTLWEKYWEGKTQDWFSLEIVSIEGYIQFLVRTRDKFRDLIEAAIYAQYPDAEITEVADYTDAAPKKFPDPEWEMFGSEWIAVKPEAYPLRTYPQFEHSLTQELKDPMAALLENMSRIGKGEQIWFQIVITPISQKEWRSAGEKLVKKLIGAKVEEKKTLLGKAVDLPAKIISPVFEQILAPAAPSVKRPAAEAPPSLMLYLSPGERTVVEAVQNKIAKIGFKTKIRGIYLAKKEIFKKTRGFHPLVGAIKQFNTLDCQSLKPELKKVGTRAHYIFIQRRKRWKQNKLMRAYGARSNWRGMGKGFVLNIEELATFWHFPASWIKAPLVKTVESKRGVPPVNLPTETSGFMEPLTSVEKEKPEVPPELPVV